MKIIPWAERVSSFWWRTDLGFHSLEYFTNPVNHCGGIPPFPPEHPLCAPERWQEDKYSEVVATKSFGFYCNFTSTQVKTKRVKEKLETPWKGNHKTLFCWMLVLVLVSVLVLILEGSKRREDPTPNSSLQTPRVAGTPVPWPYSPPVSIGASWGIYGIYSIALLSDSCRVSGQQIYPCFYPLGLAPDVEQLQDIDCSAELLGAKSRERNYRDGIKWRRMGLGFWKRIPPWQSGKALE